MKMKDKNEPVFGASEEEVESYVHQTIAQYTGRLSELRQKKADLVRQAMTVENEMAAVDNEYSAVREEILNRAHHLITREGVSDLELASELIKLAGD